MNVIHGEALAWRDMKTPTDSIHFHVTVDLAALRESVFELFHGLVVLALLDTSWIRRRPFFKPVGFSHFLAGVTASINKK